jgi:hypothetical protein
MLSKAYGFDYAWSVGAPIGGVKADFDANVDEILEALDAVGIRR